LGGVSKKRAKAAPGEPELGEDLPDEISEQQIQHMLDQADDVHIETLNETALKKMVLQLERKVKRNQELRIKHADEPDQYMKSEVDLDEEVKRFTMLATHPHLFGDFVTLEGIPVLVGLLNHVNTDIAVDVFEVLSELTDPDVIGEVSEPESFISALFDAQLCQMSVDVLLRINEEASEEDARAVTNCLTMMENLTDISPKETCTQLTQTPKLLPWLVKRVRAQGDVDYNRVYASEILGIILQNTEEAREAMVKHEGVDKLLRGIAVYRKKDPADTEEAEFVQNMFDSLCSLMLMPAHQIALGKAQGLELMIRMMREHIFASGLALRLADHALRHCPTNCQIFVDKLGLKALFAMFMKRGPKPKTVSAQKESEEHVTSIIQSLCRYCTGTAVARVLNKFCENQFEKLERLLEMHEEYARRIREADKARENGETQKIDREFEVDDEEQLFLDRCDAGLFTLQQVDIILVRLTNMGNRQATDEIGKLLDIKGVPLSEVRATLEEYCGHLDDSAREERDEIRSFMVATAKRFGDETAEPALPPREEKEMEKGEKKSGGAGDITERRDEEKKEKKEDKRSGATEKHAKHEKHEKKEKKSHRD